MEPNSYFVRFVGKANIPEPLELGNGYTVTLTGEVTHATNGNNQDGTFDTTYTFRPALCEVTDDKGKIIKAKDLRKRSEQLRFVVKRLWEADQASDTDQEEVYDRFMRYVLAHANVIYEESKK